MNKLALIYNVNLTGDELEFDYPDTIDAICRALERRFQVVRCECSKPLFNWIEKLSNLNPDLVFNIAEGHQGAMREALFPAIMDELGIMYVGNGPLSLAICQNKAMVKRIAADHKIPTPRWFLCSKPSAELPHDFHFPAIVKPNYWGSSIGLSKRSIVTSLEELREHLKWMFQQYQSSVLVEEYISQGTDMSVTYVRNLGPEIFSPVCYDGLDSQIYDFEWKKQSRNLPNIVKSYSVSQSQMTTIKEYTNSLVNAVGINSYCRIDFRLADNGTIYMLEINGQVEMAPKAEFIAAAEMNGFAFEDVVLHIASKPHPGSCFDICGEMTMP